MQTLQSKLYHNEIVFRSV